MDMQRHTYNNYVSSKKQSIALIKVLIKGLELCMFSAAN